VTTSQQISWTDVTREAVEHLGHLIAHGTSSPPGWERPAARYLLNLFEREGIAAFLLPPCAATGSASLSSSRPSLVAHIPGGEAEEPLLLLSHLDSAPRYLYDWDIPSREDGNPLMGPGALMGTHLAVAQAMALILLARSGISTRRTVRLAATSEGCGGRGAGLEILAENHLEHITSDIALGWGAISWTDSDGVRYSLLTTGEKGTLKLKLRSEGESGRIGVRSERDPVLKLVEAINRLKEIQFEPVVSEISRTLMDSLSAATDDIRKKEIYDGLNRQTYVSRFLTALEQGDIIDAGLKALINAALKTERFIVRINAVGSEGIKPFQAEAEIHYCYPPGEDVEAIALKAVEVLKSDGVYLAEKTIVEPSGSGRNAEVQSLAKAALSDVDPDAKLLTGPAPWPTGLEALRRYGTGVFGWEPYASSESLSKTLAMRGGPSEMIRPEDFTREIKAIYSFLVRAAQ